MRRVSVVRGAGARKLREKYKCGKTRTLIQGTETGERHVLDDDSTLHYVLKFRRLTNQSGKGKMQKYAKLSELFVGMKQLR